jgi:hypothetical protein
MILGVQCACRVIQWKDGDPSIEPCQLHAVADDLLKALAEIRLVAETRPTVDGTLIAIQRLARTVIEEAQS